MNKFNNYNILNEGENATSPGQLALENRAKEVYLQNRKRDNIAVNIIIPRSCLTNIDFPAAPLDLRNLLKPEKFAEKFVNGHGMMADPVSTFNNAKDFAKQCFEHASDFSALLDKQKESKFGGKGKLERGTSKQKIDPNKEAASESYYFNGAEYSMLNEAIGLAGAKAGLIVGGGVSLAGNAILGFGAGFVASTADLAAACYAIGYVGERAFGNVKDTNHFMGTTNTNDVVNSNLTTETAESDASWQGDNVIEAIDEYLRKISDSADSLLGFMNPEAKSDLWTTINNYIVEDTKGLESYIHQNSGLLKQIEQENDERRKKRAETINQSNKDIASFDEKMNRFLPGLIGKDDDIKLYTRIIDVYKSNINSRDNTLARDLDDAANDNWNAVKAVTEKESYKKRFDVHESIKYNNAHVLNEADTLTDDEDTKKPEVDGASLYNDYYNKFRQLAEEAWPKSGKLQGIDKCKANMDKLKEGCNKEITDKIALVCRTTNDGTATTTNDKIVSFFSKHPLQSKYLTNLWERHMSDLTTREENRLELMQDLSDETRIMGWLSVVFKRILPQTLARIFVYRHILMMLKQEGIYTYTPEMFKQDEKEFEDNKEYIMSDQNFIYLVYLSTLGYHWTETGKSFIIPLEDGGYNIDNTNLPVYISFLLLNCMSDSSNVSMKQISNIAQLMVGCLSKGDLDADLFVENFIAALSTSKVGQAVLDGRGSSSEVESKFSDTKLLDEVKDTVNSTFVELNAGGAVEGIKNNISSQSHDILQAGGKEFFAAVNKNFDGLIKIKDEYDKAGDDSDKKASLKKLAHNLIGIEFPNVEKVGLKDFEKCFEKVNAADKWSYIYQIYDILEIKKVADNLGSGKNAKSINAICNITRKYIKILSSGILTIGIEISEGDMMLNSIKDAYEDLDDGTKESILNFAKAVIKDQTKLSDFYTSIKDLTPDNFETISEKIIDYISEPKDEITKANGADAIQEFKGLTKDNDGVEGATSLNDLFEKDYVKVVDPEKFENVLNALAFIITTAVTNGQAYTKETMQKAIDDNEVIKNVRSLADNHAEALKQLEALDPNDPMKSIWHDLFAKMQEQFITSFNNIHKDIALATDMDVWDLLGKIRQHTDADQICANIGSFNFGGKALSDQEDKKYEIGTNLMNYLSFNELLKNEAWGKFYNETKE